MPEQPVPSILTHFAALEDPRLDRTKEHLLLDLVAIAICAVVCGAESWVDIEAYGEAKQQWLGQFLALPNGIASHDTFARVFARLDPEPLQQCFVNWIRAISALTCGEVVAIDGKQLRHSYAKGANKGAIAMVSAWATSHHLVLGQCQVDEKSNEITAIPALLQVLELSGCIVTIDAMGTQKDIAQAIVEQQADYVLALKGNQSSLYEDVQWLFEQAHQTGFDQVPPDYHQSLDKGHGRLELRRCWTLTNLDYLVQKQQWKGLQSVAMIQAERRLNGTTTTETRFYLSSLAGDAAQIANAVRSHWAIENSLHWVLDVAFGEDECRSRTDNAPHNFALLRQIGLNLLTQEKTAKLGVKAKRKKAG